MGLFRCVGWLPRLAGLPGSPAWVCRLADWTPGLACFPRWVVCPFRLAGGSAGWLPTCAPSPPVPVRPRASLYGEKPYPCHSYLAVLLSRREARLPLDLWALSEESKGSSQFPAPLKPAPVLLSARRKCRILLISGRCPRGQKKTYTTGRPPPLSSARREHSILSVPGLSPRDRGNSGSPTCIFL